MPPVREEAAGHVPMSFQALPPLKFTAAESRNFAFVAVGAVVLSNSVGGLLSGPAPWRKKSVAL
ncbi:MAG: hypothetical protein ACT4OO_08780 [Nitrospiraceae bacterium]